MRPLFTALAWIIVLDQTTTLSSSLVQGYNSVVQLTVFMLLLFQVQVLLQALVPAPVPVPVPVPVLVPVYQVQVPVPVQVSHLSHHQLLLLFHQVHLVYLVVWWTFPSFPLHSLPPITTRYTHSWRRTVWSRQAYYQISSYNNNSFKRSANNQPSFLSLIILLLQKYCQYVILFYRCFSSS